MNSVISSGIHIKAATADHAVSAAELIFDTDPHVFEYWFKGDKERAIQYFAFQWQTTEGPFSHSFSRGAFDGDNLVGIEIGYDRKTQQSEGRAFFRQAKELLSDSDFDHFSRALGYMPFLNPPIPRDAYYLQNLAVLEERQKEGIGKLLIQSAFDRAAEGGYRSCHLDVAGDNPALTFYRRLGMETLCEVRLPLLEERHHITRHYRMVKAF